MASYPRGSTVDRVEIITVEKKPLQPVDDPALNFDFDIKEVAVGVKKGIEFQIGSAAMADPNADCWFAISLEYDWRLRDGSMDADIIITDGEQFFLARRRLGDSKLKLTASVRRQLIKAIKDYTRKL